IAVKSNAGGDAKIHEVRSAARAARRHQIACHLIVCDSQARPTAAVQIGKGDTQSPSARPGHSRVGEVAVAQITVEDARKRRIVARATCALNAGEIAKLRDTGLRTEPGIVGDKQVESPRTWNGLRPCSRCSPGLRLQSGLCSHITEGPHPLGPLLPAL